MYKICKDEEKDQKNMKLLFLSLSMKPFNQFVQVFRSKIFLFIRYKHYKMFGTNATNEKGLPADPCRGDSGKE